MRSDTHEVDELSSFTCRCSIVLFSPNINICMFICQCLKVCPHQCPYASLELQTVYLPTIYHLGEALWCAYGRLQSEMYAWLSIYICVTVCLFVSVHIALSPYVCCISRRCRVSRNKWLTNTINCHTPLSTMQIPIWRHKLKRLPLWRKVMICHNRRVRKWIVLEQERRMGVVLAGFHCRSQYDTAQLQTGDRIK